MQEIRHDPLSGDSVIIAPDRARRPNAFVEEQTRPAPDPACPFCPGNEGQTPPEIWADRREGPPDSPGWSLRVFPNKYPALTRGPGGLAAAGGNGFYEALEGYGPHELIVETPRHAETLADLDVPRMAALLGVFQWRIRELAADPRLAHVGIFKNHGRGSGASIAHSHSQLLGLPLVPRRVRDELERAERHFASNGRCLACRMLDEELAEGARVVLENGEFVCLAPYASRVPYELALYPRRHEARFEAVPDGPERAGLAAALRGALGALNGLLSHPPYNLVLHSAPLREGHRSSYHWHIEILPRLAQLGGCELGTGLYMNPFAPEDAAAALREAASRPGPR